MNHKTNRAGWLRSKAGAWLCAALLLTLLTPLAQAQSTITRTSSFEYDESGLLIREVIEPDRPQDCLQTTHSYNAQGNPTLKSSSACAGASGHTIASAGTRSTTKEYLGQTVVIEGVSYSTPAGVFATRTTNALNHSESYEYDPRHGQVVKLTGPNGGVTTWAYDSFGRKTRENRADGTYTVWDYKFCQVQGQALDPVCAGAGNGGAVSDGNVAHTLEWYVREVSYAGNGVALSAAKYQIHDTLGRAVRVRSDSFMAEGEAINRQPSLQDTVYNALGQAVSKSIAYLLSGGTPQYSRYEYDAIGRVTQETSPDGNGAEAVLQTAYNGLQTVITNALNQAKTIVKNAQGQTERVEDAQGSSVLYSYDALGQLTQTNAAGSITQLSYDLRGRKTSMQDPAMGRWDYAYNAFGELVWQQDSLSQVVSMQYDALGRLVGRDEADQLSRWYHDSKADGSACGASVGKLCEATADNGYRRLHSYDSLGRPISTSNVLNSETQPAVVTQAYDSITGRLKEQTWPSGYKAVYEYTEAGASWSAGHLWRVKGMDGATQNALWQAMDKDPQGRLTRTLGGNGVVTRKSIEQATGRVNALSSTLTGQAEGNVLNQTYSYDALGNLLTRADANTNVSESFSYDSLNRLGSATTTASALSSTQSVQVLYDARGNIQYKSDVGYYHYDGARPNRLTAITLALSQGESLEGATLTNTGTRTLSYAFDDELAGVRSVDLGQGSVSLGNGNLMYTVSQDSVGGPHTVRWEEYTSFNKIRQMRFGNLTNPQNPTDAVADRTVEFVYGPEHQRLRQTVQLTSNAPSHMEAGSTWYMNGADSLGLSYEQEVKASGLVEHKHYLTAGGEVFAQFIKREGNLGNKPQKQVSYWHQDHLGSLSAITNEAGQVIERLAYDPWGKRRFTDGNKDASDTLTSANTKRGYTLHEHMDEMGVINMNGRVYDPLIGRFLTADPFIQSPDDLQSYGRYTYVRNNPLNKVDPSGFSWWTKFRDRVLKPVVAAVLDATVCGGYCTMALNAYNAAKAKNPIGFVLAFTGVPSNPIAAAAITAGSGCVGAMANGGNCGRGAGSALLQYGGTQAGGAIGSLVGGCAASANQGGSCRRGVEQAATTMATDYLASAAQNSINKATDPPPNNVSEFKPGSSVQLAGGDGGYTINGVAGANPLHIPALNKMQNVLDVAQSTVDANCGGWCYVPFLRGIFIHGAFDKGIKAMNDPDFSSEVSYKDRLLTRYGDGGSVRADGVNGNPVSPNFIVDVKTGWAYMSNGQANAYREHLPFGTDIYILRPRADQ